MSDIAKLKSVQAHLQNQRDCKHTRILIVNGVECVEAILVNTLTGGATYRRTCYYDANGTKINPNTVGAK